MKISATNLEVLATIFSDWDCFHSLYKENDKQERNIPPPNADRNEKKRAQHAKCLKVMRSYKRSFAVLSE